MWIPCSEADILSAIDAGNLAENVHLDVKRDTGDSNSQRAETARDLASFAIHGGGLLIGVSENKADRAFEAAPQPLAGLGEKIEQIAANRVDPPLFVRVHDIPTAADPSRGYVFVEVPPSAQAPHMVEGRYYARGDRTKRRLTDAEVVALHAARPAVEDRIRQVLSAWSSRPVIPPGSEGRNGHLNIIALPLTPIPSDSLRDISRAPNNTPAFNLARDASNDVPAALVNFQPSIFTARNWVHRRDGSALTSLKPGKPRLEDVRDQNYLIDFEIRDDGSFGILMGRLVVANMTQTQHPVVFGLPAAGFAWQAARIAARISEHVGYRGAWGLGLHADGLAGAVSYEPDERRVSFFPALHPYSEDDYTAVTTAHVTELEDQPDAVVERLTGTFLLGLGSHAAFRDVVATAQG